MTIDNRTLRALFLASALCLAAGWLSGCGSNAVSGKSDTFTDARDGKEYRTVKIGAQTWMAENLNYQPRRGKSWCYGDSDSNCGKYGRLYNWETAKMACPSGWHLPSRKEWETLIEYAGGEDSAGKKLKTTGDWRNIGVWGNIRIGVGADEFGFSALPGGYRNFNNKADGDHYFNYNADGYPKYGDGCCGFRGAGKSGAWWTATWEGYRWGDWLDNYKIDAYRVIMHDGFDYTSVAKSDNERGLSVRCVMDDGNNSGSGGKPAAARRTEPADFIDSAAGFEMAFVKGGMFLMGCTDEQRDCGRGERRHFATVGDFYIGKHEVTQKQWMLVMGNNPSDGDTGENFPVNNVSWYDIQEFIKRLNTMTGEAYRLPRDAEWEYAARGGAKNEGHIFAGGDSVDAVAWHGGNGGGKIHPVGSKAPNELGIYDMGGNAWEWVGDWHEGDDYHNQFTPSTFNPTGPVSGAARVIRGGGWPFDAWFCRVSARYPYNPGHRFGYLGFRLAVSASRRNPEQMPAFDMLADDRDGKFYKTAKVGALTWMAENLNYRPPNGKSWCYRRDTSYCKEYGRLYDWNTAAEACPSGWHLPSNSEWENLIVSAGGADAADRKLKSESGWSDADGGNGNGDDEYGFSALPGGTRLLDNSSGRFGNAGRGGYWWTADKCHYYIYSGSGGVSGDCMVKGRGYSVRCVKDYVNHPRGNKLEPARKAEPAGPAGDTSLIAREMLAGNRDGNKYKAVRMPNGLRDARDGKTYKTVKIGALTWMAENLNYNDGNSVCYDSDKSYCGKYGRLYLWNAALDACPAGWHLPSRVEWDYLGYATGGERELDDDSGDDRVHWHGAGRKLKSAKGWNGWDGDGGNGSDEFGFSALPGGRHGGYGGSNFIGSQGTWWTSEAGNASGAYGRTMEFRSETMTEDFYGKGSGRSVRCVKGEKSLQPQPKNGGRPNSGIMWENLL